MKKKYLMAVGSLSVAGIMTVFSFTSATITSAASMTVTNTDTALLALSAGQQFLNDGTAQFVSPHGGTGHDTETGTHTDGGTDSGDGTHQSGGNGSPGTGENGGSHGSGALGGASHAYLSFNFAKGNGGNLYGVQRNSTYEWDGLLVIKNNSAQTIRPQIALENGATNGGIYSMEASGSANWQVITAGNTQIWQGQPIGPGQSVAVDVKYTLGNAADTANQTDTPNFVVSASAVPSSP